MKKYDIKCLECGERENMNLANIGSNAIRIEIVCNKKNKESMGKLDYPCKNQKSRFVAQ